MIVWCEHHCLICKRDDSSSDWVKDHLKIHLGWSRMIQWVNQLHSPAWLGGRCRVAFCSLWSLGRVWTMQLRCHLLSARLLFHTTDRSMHGTVLTIAWWSSSPCILLPLTYGGEFWNEWLLWFRAVSWCWPSSCLLKRSCDLPWECAPTLPRWIHNHSPIQPGGYHQLTLVGSLTRGNP